MASWQEFAQAAPEIADAGRALLYQHGPGLAFLATVRRDGAPRLHPICPVIVDGALSALIIPSPKLDDLLRDGRYALHAFPPAAGDDEFSVSGRAEAVADRQRRDAVTAALAALGVTSGPDHTLFLLSIERAMHAAYQLGVAWPPVYRRWHDPAAFIR